MRLPNPEMLTDKKTEKVLFKFLSTIFSIAFLQNFHINLYFPDYPGQQQKNCFYMNNPLVPNI